MVRNQASFFYQFLLIFKRNSLVYLRVPATSIVKLLVPMLTASLIGWMFHGVDGTFMGVRNRNGVLFFSDVSIGFVAMQFTVLVFPYERPIFLREIGNNMYSVGPYFLGRLFAELPGCIIVPTLYGSIIYFMVGLATNLAWKFPLYIGILIAVYNTSTSLSFCISAACKDRITAITVAPLFDLTMMIFTGFVVSLSQITPYLRWLQYPSFYKYGYQALMLNEYYELDLPCMHEEYFHCDPLGDFDSPQTIEESLLAMGIMYLGLTFIAYLILKYVATNPE